MDRRPQSRLRRLEGIACAAIFACQFVVLDLIFRGPGAVIAEPRLVVSMLGNALVWGAVLLALRVRRARLAIALPIAFLIVVQVFIFRYYHVPLDVQVAESALHGWRDVRPLIAGSLLWVILATLVGACIEVALLERAHQSNSAVLPSIESRNGIFILGAAALAGLFDGGPRRGTADVRGLHALTALTHERGNSSTHNNSRTGVVSLPLLHSDRDELSNMLFVLTESVRAEDYIASGPEATAPETAQALRTRIDLGQMRSVSSYTSISFSAILTGRSQEAEREQILRAPNLFDFAHAARDSRGRRLYVAYYSAQSREIFETKDVRGAVDRFITAEDLIGREIDDEERALDDQPLDRMITRRLIEDLPTLPRPFAIVLHLYSTHVPYFFDDDRARFTPFARVVGWSDMHKLHNAYKSAIVEQDHQIAKVVTAFTQVSASAGSKWLAAFTSDHGEAFAERGAIHHGQNLYDEQVHVPGWIAAGPGVLNASQTAALSASANAFTTHLDLLPTLLDAMGLWDNSAVRGHRALMGGSSLLRPVTTRDPIPITNCTGLFRCPVNTWGIYRGDRKLVAQAWDGGWVCTELGRGSEHPAASADPECERLRDASHRAFPLLPNGRPNR